MLPIVSDVEVDLRLAVTATAFLATSGFTATTRRVYRRTLDALVADLEPDVAVDQAALPLLETVAVRNLRSAERLHRLALAEPAVGEHPAVRDVPATIVSEAAIGAANGTDERWAGRLRLAGDSMKYDAFISYSHAADGELAPKLRNGLQQFARKWNELRALRVFHDQTGLTLTENLWAGIQRALDDSRHFVLLASPRAADSSWVNRELARWKAREPRVPIFLVLTDGELVWDTATGDFDAKQSTALPDELAGVFDEEPQILDMLWAQDAGQLDLRNGKFRSAVADLAAPIHGIDRDEIEGEDVRRHKKAKVLRRFAIGALATLTAVAIVVSVVAVVFQRTAARNAAEARSQTELAREQTAAAEKLARDARSGELALLSGLALERTPGLATLLAVEAARVTTSAGDGLTPGAVRALREAAASPWRASLAHVDTVASARFSPDGSRVVTASADGTAKVWESTGALLASLEHDAGSRVTSARFSPDGSLIVTAGGDGRARLWDPADGEQAVEVLDRDCPVRDAMFSPNGSRIVTVCSEAAFLWDSVGSFVGDLGRIDFLTTATFSPDGSLIVVRIEGAARVWDSSGGEVAVLTHDAPDHLADTVWSAEFSPDGRRIVTTGNDDFVKVWTATGRLMREAEQYRVRSASFSPDGTLVATGGEGNDAHVWDDDLNLVATLDHSDGLGPTGALWSPAGDRILTSGSGDLKLWHADGEPVATLPDSGFFPRFSLDGTRIIVDRNDTARVFLARNGTPVGTFRHTGNVSFADFSRDGTAIVTASRDGTARVWATPAALDHDAISAEFSPDGDRVLTAGADDAARVWDVSGRLVAELAPGSDELAGLPGGGSGLASAEFSPDGSQILTAAVDATTGYAFLWDYEGGRVVAAYVHPPRVDVFSAGFGPDGNTVVTDGASGTITWLLDGTQVSRDWARHGIPGPDGSHALRVREGEVEVTDVGGNIVALFKHGSSRPSAQFSPDGSRVLTFAGDPGEREAKIWDLDGGVLSLPHPQNVEWARFTEGGARVLTSSGNSAFLWDEGGTRFASFVHSDTVESAEFSPEGTQIITASQDGTAKVWDVGGELLGTLPHLRPLRRASFNSSGTHILTVDSFGLAVVWEWLEPGAALGEATRRLGNRRFTESECEQYRIDPCASEESPGQAPD